MMASAFPLADVLMDREGAARRADDSNAPSPDELPFPGGAADGSANAGSANPDDASSVPGSRAGAGAFASSGTGSAMLDQVLGAARLAGYDIELPQLPVDKLAPVNPLRPAILAWIQATNAQVEPAELARELARADALPQPLQRDLALVILSAAEATRLQNLATAQLAPEQLAWIHQHPEAASDLARGIVTPDTRHLAFLAGLVDYPKSVQASLLLLQAAEATRGSLASAAATTTFEQVAQTTLDPAAQELLRLLASAGSLVSDKDKILFAAELVALGAGLEVPAAPTGDLTFAAALDALLSSTSTTPDAADVADVVGRAELLPADLQRALALPILAQARAVDAANPLYYTEGGQTEAMLHVLVAIAEAIPTLEKYHLYWRGVPDALRVSTWDAPARLAWAAEHGALLAVTGGAPANAIRAGGILQGLELLDARAPELSFVDAFVALAEQSGQPALPGDIENVRRASDMLAPATRDAAARLLSGAAEAARLNALAYADLTADERDYLLVQSLDVNDMLMKAEPTHAELQKLARLTELAERVDRARLIEAGVAAARAMVEARDILDGASAYGAQSSRVTHVDTGFGAFLSRLLPWQTASAQGATPCQDIEMPVDRSGFSGEHLLFLVDNDCASDILLRIHFPDGMRHRTMGTQTCTDFERPNNEMLVISGTGSTTHRPVMDERKTYPVVGMGMLAMCDMSQPPVVQPAPRFGASTVSLDLGGPDAYERPVAMTFPAQRVPVSLHLDVDGGDTYADPTGAYDEVSPIYAFLDTREVGHPTQGSTAGSGVAILIDGAGDDTFAAPAQSQGFGRFGVGMLADFGGRDSYFARNFTQGAATETWSAGLGILIDQDGDDTYIARGGQGYGVGGMLIDAGGSDSYSNDRAPTGVPIAHLSIIPGGETTALNERKDGRIWLDGPDGLNPGIAIDYTRAGSDDDTDGDGWDDFTEFVAGSNPQAKESTPEDGPFERAAFVAQDTDGDLFPDYIERVLSTDPDEKTDYPVGFPTGGSLFLPLLGEFDYGPLTGIEGAPRGHDKIIDLRLPLQDAGTIDRACTGPVIFDYNVTGTAGPDYAINDGVTLLLGEESIGGMGWEQKTMNLRDMPSGRQASRCSYLTYESNGDGTGNATLPQFDSPNEQKVRDNEFTFSFPRGLLAIGDAVPTSYQDDYFVVIDLGGNDAFQNRAGGAVPVRTEQKEVADPNRKQNRDNAFLAPTLVLNVDVASTSESIVQNPEGDFGSDTYARPVNATHLHFAQGSLFGLLVDVTGWDTYVADDASQGALGGVLLDLDGVDKYSAGNLSQGAALLMGRDGDKNFQDQPGYPDAKTRPSTIETGLGNQNNKAALTSSSMLLDLGLLNDFYLAGSHSQAFARAFNQNQTLTGAILLDAGGDDLYSTASKKGFDSQAVSTAGGVAILADLSGDDDYIAYGRISQGASTSATYGWTANQSNPEPTLAVLADLGGDDTYTYHQRGDVIKGRTESRQNTLTVTRSETLTGTESSGYRYNGQTALHLDADLGSTEDPAAPINAIAGAPDGIQANNFTLNLPTARLAIGDPSPTRYDHEYALVIDLGGENAYNFNAGGFVPDVLLRSPTSRDDTLGGGAERTLSLFPVSLLLDVGAEPSTYTAKSLLSQGAGFFSVGVLVDAGGADTFVALPEAQWSRAAAWKTEPVTIDGIITPREWSDVTSHTVTLTGTRDARFDQGARVRIANDERRLFVALEISTSSTRASEFNRERITLELNPYRSLKEYNVDGDATTPDTGIDQIVIEMAGPACSARDNHYYESGGVSGFYDDRDDNHAGGLETTTSPSELTLNRQDVTIGCKLVDGTWHIELSKPFAPRGVPKDGYSDMTYTYDATVGFLQDVDVGFRLAFAEGASRESFVFPAGSTSKDGDYGHRNDGSHADELSAWAAFSLANLGKKSPAPMNSRVAALAQGAAIAGVGIVAMVGSADSAATYTATERSQGYAAFGALAMLLDLGGDDTYIGGTLVQGAADTNGVGVFVDTEGNDEYRSLTRANGYPGNGGAATFADLHGFDRYHTFGFFVTGVPACITNPGQACERSPGVELAKGNQKTWRQGNAGVGVDLFSEDEVRNQPIGLMEQALFGATQTNVQFFPVTSSSQCTWSLYNDQGAGQFPVDPVITKMVVYDSVCMVAKVNVTGGSGVAGRVIGTDNVTFVVNYGEQRVTGRGQRGEEGISYWMATINSTLLQDGVQELAAQAIFRAETPARDTLLLMDDVRREAEGTSRRRVVVNNEPLIDLDLEPKAKGQVMWSPSASTQTNQLFVNWSVSPDGGEYRLEAVEGYKPNLFGRNVPCTHEDAYAPEDEKQLCHVLPFYFKPKEGDARWDTTPWTDAERLVTERSDPNPELSDQLATLKTPLRIWKEGGLTLQLPGRTALMTGDFDTNIRLTLLNAEGDPYLHEGKKVILSENVYESNQDPRLGTIGGGLASELGTVFSTARNASVAVSNATSGNTAHDAVATGTNIVCGLAAPCGDHYSGNYGAGILRPCRESFWNNWLAPTLPPPIGTVRPLAPAAVVAQQPICHSHTPMNITNRALNDTGPILQELVINEVSKQVDDVANSLEAEATSGKNWTVFHIELADAVGPVRDMGDYIEIPPGYSIGFEMMTVRGPIAGDVGGQQIFALNDFYQRVVLDGEPIVDGVQAPGLKSVFNDADQQQCPPGDDAPRCRDVLGTTIPIFNVGDIVDQTVEHQIVNNTNFNGADTLLQNPLPISFFRIGSADQPARLEIRTPTEPTTSVTVTLEQVGGSAVHTLVDGVFVGDVNGTTSNFVIEPAGDTTYKVSLDERRFSQRETTFSGDIQDGTYRVRVVANESYTDIAREQRMTLLVDGTPPIPIIKTPEFVGEALLADHNNKVPFMWEASESGSGHKQTWVYWSKTGTDASTCDATGNVVGDWRRAKDAPFPSSVNVTAQEELSVGQVMRLIVLPEDFAGNLPFADGKGLCDAVKGAAQAGANVGYREIRVDDVEPLLGRAGIEGSRVLTFKGSDFDYIKAGAPVRFFACADDGDGVAAKTVVFVLYNVDVNTAKVLNYTYQATPDGACADGRTRFVFGSWHTENADKSRFPDGVWSAVAEAYDRANNRVSASAGNIILDSAAPTLELQPVIYPQGQSAVKGRDTFHVRVLASDDWDVDYDAITVDASPLNTTGVLATKTRPIAGVAYREAEITVDRTDIENGEFDVIVRVPDNAGNVAEAAFVVRVDFKQFEIVADSLRVTNITHNSAILRWETTENTTALVRYGGALNDLRQRTNTTLNGTTEHEVLVTGLTPSTRYYLRGTSFSAGGFAINTDVIPVDTLTALFLEPVSPAEGDAVSGLIDVAFEGGLRDSDDFVSYTLYVHQPHREEEWTFVTTTTRQGLDHVIRWNSTRHLDGDGYKLRLVAKAGRDVDETVFGPFVSDNAKPVVTVASPAPAVNTTRPDISIGIRDALSGFDAESPVLLIDGREVNGTRVERADPKNMRILHTLATPLSDGPHTFEVQVADRAGNAAKHTWEVFVDGDAPVIRQNKMTFVPGTTAARAGGQVILNLTVQDASGVAEVLVDASSLKEGQVDVPLKRMAGTDFWTTALDVSARDLDATKIVRVTAFDRATNARVAEVAVPLDNEAPSIRGGARVLNVTHTTASILVAEASEPVIVRATATAPETPQAAAATSELSLSPTVEFAGLLPSRSYEYSLRIIDGAGNSFNLVGRFATQQDGVDPSTVTGLTVVDLLNGTLRLAWEPATDDIGVAFYRVYRSDDGGASFTQIAELEGLSYQDGQLPYEKSFTYQVVAVDHGGNEGAPSDRLTAAATALPRISAGTASPSVGTTATVFRYTITYVSAAGKAPTSIHVIIDGVPHEMTRVGEEGSFATGVTYAYETRLAPHTRDAPHTYSFEATDGRYTVAFPEDGSSIRGPLVSSDAFASEGGGFASFAQRVPVGGVAGFTLAILAAALVATLVVRKKKMGGSNK